MNNDVNSVGNYYTYGWNDPIMIMSVLDQNSEFNGDFCIVLSFEPIDLDSAESVELAVESSGDDIELITVK